MTREDYESAKMNGLEDRLRGDAISKNISHGIDPSDKGIPLSEQVSILRKQLHAVVTVLEEVTGKSVFTNNFKRLYALAEEAIASVDATINEMEASINEDTVT